MSRITKIKLRKAKAAFESNMKLAEEFPHNPELEEKFLLQAIAEEVTIKRLSALR